MCGIAGFWSLTAAEASAVETIAWGMADTLLTRGPDDGGVWRDSSHHLALAHRRLSILDLSPAGHQPMHSACGRFVLVFNGEIYNHLELREALASHYSQSSARGDDPPSPPPPLPGGEGSWAWRGHSDTETLLAGFEAWGVAATLQRTIGMFAIAVWDRAERTLTLARPSKRMTTPGDRSRTARKWPYSVRPIRSSHYKCVGPSGIPLRGRNIDTGSGQSPGEPSSTSSGSKP